MTTRIADDEAVVGKYQFFTIEALAQNPSRKTRDYIVVGRHDMILAGIEYCSRWRQHVFCPYPETIWSAGCLANVNDFLAKIKRGEV